jgi:hypothetical protein
MFYRIKSSGGAEMILKENPASQKVFKDMGMNKWRETKMADLKKGTRVRLYSPSGRPLELGGEETFLTESDSFEVDGVWAVKVKKA